MIGVLTLFGETDLQSDLKNVFDRNDLRFIKENAVTDVQLIGFCSENADKVDVVIVAGNAVNLSSFTGLATELINICSSIRIVLVLNGKRSQYLRSQLERYRSMKVDLIFDDNGFDVQILVDCVKKGRLVSNTEKKSGFCDETDTEEPNIIEAPTSFVNPAGHYKIGVMNATHGAGATSVVVNLANYFSMQNFQTAVLDLSGSEALTLAEMKDAEVSVDAADIDDLCGRNNILMIDFGTPYSISAKGGAFKIRQGYSANNFNEIKRCDLKLILGFADEWNINKLKFFLENEGWADTVDNSYMFLVSHSARKLKQQYPHINIFNRDDDYTEMIFDTLRKEE